ncbi:CubicO group peptidase (beta-lactamase class C family) [Brevundimonas alba]|uniref:CubicO group peptidase (Beta-lactamase class C family) n=1 Tax=Brevundimonas alba TaxID=74314 RepID=A0A7X5YKI6_9CAUL|nr:serine hydrolase domain-containing protein [Brevundimonas alba]NJC41354.1 CubicO group peptidase (beta-lactamase class C family) [Brevundimonas alba]
MNRRRAMALIGATAMAGAARPALARETPDDVLDAVFAEHAPPALAFGIMGAEGLRWSGVRGVRRRGSDDAATLQDRWHLGSNTKAMTAAIYGRLVDRGQTRWQRPLVDIFPEMAADPAWQGITVDQLMSHHAGLRDDDLLPREVRVAARDDARPLVEQRLDRVRAALATAPGGTVGTYAYANIDYVLAGAAVERITGQSWEAAMQSELFEPLGITSGGFGAPEGAQPWGHQTLGAISTPLDPLLKPDNPPLMGPAGTAHMSLSDYARFLGLFLNRGGDVLSPAAFEVLTTPGEGVGRDYALGWAVERPGWAAGPVLVHEGSNTLWHAIALLDPVGGVGYLGMSNESTRGGPALGALVQRLVRTAGG